MRRSACNSAKGGRRCRRRRYERPRGARLGRADAFHADERHGALEHRVSNDGAGQRTFTAIPPFEAFAGSGHAQRDNSGIVARADHRPRHGIASDLSIRRQDAGFGNARESDAIVRQEGERAPRHGLVIRSRNPLPAPKRRPTRGTLPGACWTPCAPCKTTGLRTRHQPGVMARRTFKVEKPGRLRAHEKGRRSALFRDSTALAYQAVPRRPSTNIPRPPSAASNAPSPNRLSVGTANCGAPANTTDVVLFAGVGSAGVEPVIDAVLVN